MFYDNRLMFLLFMYLSFVGKVYLLCYLKQIILIEYFLILPMIITGRCIALLSGGDLNY
jgi:hypothetical protein